jgi:hypothetical protein
MIYVSDDRFRNAQTLRLVHQMKKPLSSHTRIQRLSQIFFTTLSSPDPVNMILQRYTKKASMSNGHEPQPRDTSRNDPSTFLLLEGRRGSNDTGGRAIWNFFVSDFQRGAIGDFANGQVLYRECGKGCVKYSGYSQSYYLLSSMAACTTE